MSLEFIKKYEDIEPELVKSLRIIKDSINQLNLQIENDKQQGKGLKHI